MDVLLEKWWIINLFAVSYLKTTLNMCMWHSEYKNIIIRKNILFLVNRNLYKKYLNNNK